MIISLIVAMDRNRVIGFHNRLPWHLPSDLKHFKAVTMGKPIIMGRKTFESIGKPLPGRRNMILTRNKDYNANGVDVFSSLQEALAAVEDLKEVMIIGGGSIYSEALPFASRIYLTTVDYQFAGDTFFPKIDEAQWIESNREDHLVDDNNPYPYSSVTLNRRGGS